MLKTIAKVARFEITRTLRKKSFWITALIIPIGGGIIGGIIYFSNHTANTADNQKIQSVITHKKVAVLDESHVIAPKTLTSLHVHLEKNKQDGIMQVKSGKLDAFIYYPPHIGKDGISIYSNNTGLISSTYNEPAISLIKQSALAQIKLVNVNQQVVSVLQKDPTVHVSAYKNGVVTHGFNDVIAPGILAVLFLVSLILLANQMLASVTEEKENRTAEILLTSIDSKSLILGKIIAIVVVGFLQIFVTIVPILLVRLAMFGSHISLSAIQFDSTRLLLGAVYLILGFLMYTGLLVGIGAMSPSAKEAAPFLSVTFIWTYAPFYILGLLLSDSQNIVIKIFTYFPLTAPTTVLLRNALGNLTGTDILITLPLLTVCAVLAILFAVEAFRRGVMEYDHRIRLGDILRFRSLIARI